jgi:hypothetical protein
MSHRPRSRTIALALAGIALAATATARADVASQPPAPPASDTSLNVGQFALGAGTMIGATFLAGKLVDHDEFGGAIWLQLFAPFVVGEEVCNLGRLSVRHEGGCGLALGGAYLGASAIVPIALLACNFSIHATAGEDSVCLAALRFTWYVLPPFAAVLGWNEGKTLRAGAAPDRLPDPPLPRSTDLELSMRHWEGGAPDAHRVTFSLLAFRF